MDIETDAEGGRVEASGEERSAPGREAASARPPVPRGWRRLVPAGLRRTLRERLNDRIRARRQPKMLWGYRDGTGTWRPRTRISDTAFLYHPEGIRVADNVFVWHYTILDGTGGLTIGEGTQVGAWVGIFTHSSHFAIRLYGDHYQQVPESEKVAFGIAPVSIGRYVFLAAGSKVLPGVSVGDGALVGAGSLVRDDVAPFQIVAGNPAKVVGDTRELDARYLEDPEIRKWYSQWQRNAEDGS